jgi:tetratricopeptide (TPR) repeat protein
LKASDPRAFRALGRLYVGEKQFQKGADALTRLQSLSQLTAADHFFFGAALLELDNAAAAKEQLTQAIALAPENPLPYLSMYSADMKLSQPKEALSILDEYLRRFPHDKNHDLAEARKDKLRAALKPRN